MLKKLKNILKVIGPGFIVASVVLGPGSVTVSSRIGSAYGYSLLWVIIFAAVSMVVYTAMGARFGVTHNQSFLQAISDKYGRWFAVLIGISAFLSSSSFQFGNNLGIGIGMFGVTGIEEKVWPIVFTSLAIILIFWAKNLYKILEKIMLFMVMIMILAFLFNLFLVKPDVVSTLEGFLPVSFPSGHFNEIIALVGTTFVLNASLFYSYLAQDKGWKVENLKDSLRDTNSGIFILGLISALIIITSATALHPRGIEVNSAADMAIQLELLFGSYAKIVFSLGLCAAAFSSLLVNSIMGGCLLSDGLGLGRSMGEKYPKVFTLLTLLVGMSIAVFFKGDIIYALIMAQAASILCVPLIAIGMILIVNDKNIMGEYANSKMQNWAAAFGLILISVMVYFLYSKLIKYFSEII